MKKDMKRFGLLRWVGILGVLCGEVVAQQFRILEYDGDTVTIEYPPSFAGAYLFVEKNTNLVSGIWEVVDYSQVALVEGAEAFAGGSLGTHGASLDYSTASSTVPVSEVKIRDWLLAKAFPARTRPMGATRVGDIGGGWNDDSNFDMSDPEDGFMTNPGQWPNEDNNHNKEWRHSDLKKVPYVHVYKMYEKITGKEN